MFWVLKTDGVLIRSVPNGFNLFNRLHIFIRGKSIQSGVYQEFKQYKHHTLFS